MIKQKGRKLINTIISENILPLLVMSIILSIIFSITANILIFQGSEHEIQVAAISYENYIEKSLTESTNSMWFIKSGIDELPNIQNQSLFLNNIILSIIKNNNLFERLEIIDSTARIIAAAPNKDLYIGSDRSSSDAYLKTSTDGALLWSTPFTSEYNGQVSMTVSYKYKQYTVVGYINFNKISEISFNFERVNKDFNVHITNANGVYIYHKNREYFEQRRIDENFNFFSKKENTNKIIKNILIDNMKSTAIAEKLEYANWVLVLHMSNKIVLNRIILTELFIISIFLFIILVVYYFSVKRGKLIVKSLSDLANQTKKIAGGNYEASISEQKYDEFDMLVNDFNIMVSEIQRKNQELNEIAFTDELTNILNRKGFHLKINEIISDKQLKKFTLLFMDIDNFKRINDTYGHSMGDVLLYEFICKLKLMVPPDVTIARLGGDEFILCCTGDEYYNDSADKAKALLSLASMPFMCLGKEIRITISIGIARYPDDANNYETLIQMADIALYNAKDKGKNTYSIYDKGMSDSLSTSFAIEQALKTALVNDEFKLVFQPQVGNHNIIGYEALIRWNSPQFGLVKPDVFLPVVEESNDIISIGRWVFDNSCKTIKKINEKYNSQLPISVNFSSTEILSEGFRDFIKETIIINEIPPHWIGIEITEHMMMQSTLEAIEMLENLIDFGIAIILDDFGTGYSSLSHIGTLPVGIVKIDRSFITNMENDDKRRRIIDSLINMIHNLDKVVVAEGVENVQQCEMLAQMGCDGIQGYYYAKPLDIDNLYKFIENFPN